MAYILRPANAAITGAIGFSSYAREKAKSSSLGKDPSNQIVELPSAPVGGPALPGNSKYTCRSLLADIIQLQDVKELCSVLVVWLEEAAKTLAEQKDAKEKLAKEQTETSLSMSTKQGTQNQVDGDKTVAKDRSSASQAPDKSVQDESDTEVSADMPQLRGQCPLGLLALMCDEQDTMFLAAASSKGLMGAGGNFKSTVASW
ncbi:hypothetical protein CRG98_033831 [Punica granatum]|uniref:Uncharacterized protein n=1 Tax=Punica granatum TaxID=22663 RepID=A0A2I0IP97_PUNGR|nr:hypothetical protein CRG98_033831 [Punica granatum]